MSGLSQRLATQWLRDRAMELRASANRAEDAYGSGSGYRAGRYVAQAYRKAAAVLDDAATEAEDNPSVLEADK